MATRYTTRVRVNAPEIAGMFHVGGQVSDEATKITVETKALAEALAPERTGELKHSHIRNVVSSGIYGTRGFVENLSPHALYVHEGVKGIIVPQRRLYMKLSPWPPYGFINAHEVRGQSDNPWLLNAARIVFRRYGVNVQPEFNVGDI